MAANEEVTMMMSVVPGAMTGISTMMSGLVSINNVFLDMTRQIDATFGLIDSSIVTAGTVVAQLGFKAAEAFGEFEQGMKVVQMVSNQTAADMDILKQKANEFSVSYRTDIDQITEGLQTLGRAGLNSAAEQTEVLQNGLSTAKLESRELNSVLEELIQNTSLLGGDLKSSDFGEVSSYLNDLLVATSMTAPITTHDVSETLKYSGGIAAAAGANVNTDEGKALLEDYMAAIAAFAQKGVTGSIAGTALRAFFTKPASQDSSVTEALSSIHLKPEYLWEDDEQTMKPVSEQIKIIKDQMNDLNVSTMDQLQIWSKIVGGKMGQQMMKLDSDSIKEITKDIQAADSAQSKAAGTFQTFQSNMKEMTEQGQVAFREFGERVAYVLNPLIDLVTKFLDILSNPAISTGLFAGFIALIGQAYQKIKKIFDSLKSEFSEFKKAFMSDEKLMAMRPSYERYHGKRGGIKDIMEYHQEGDPIKAYKKELQMRERESKIEKGYTSEMFYFEDLIEKDFRKYKKNPTYYIDSALDTIGFNQGLPYDTLEGKVIRSIFKNPISYQKLGFETIPSNNYGQVLMKLMEEGLFDSKWSDFYFNSDTPFDTKALIDKFGDEILNAFIQYATTILRKETAEITEQMKMMSKNDDYLIKLNNFMTPIIDETWDRKFPFLDDRLLGEGGEYSKGKRDKNKERKAQEVQKIRERLLGHTKNKEEYIYYNDILEYLEEKKGITQEDLKTVNLEEVLTERDIERLLARARKTDERLNTNRVKNALNLNKSDFSIGDVADKLVVGRSRDIPDNLDDLFKQENVLGDYDEAEREILHSAMDNYSAPKEKQSDYQTEVITDVQQVVTDILNFVEHNPMYRHQIPLMSPEEIKSFYKRKTKLPLNVKNANLDLAMKEVRGQLRVTEKEYEDYQRYQRMHRGEDVLPEDYYDTPYFKELQLTEEYQSKDLFAKMSLKRPMSGEDFKKFALFNSKEILHLDDQIFAAKTGELYGYNIPMNAFFQEVGFEDFLNFETDVVGKNGQKETIRQRVKSQRTQFQLFTKFQEEMKEKKKQLAILTKFAEEIYAGTDNYLERITSDPVEKLDTKSDEKTIKQLAKTFGIKLKGRSVPELKEMVINEINSIDNVSDLDNIDLKKIKVT